MATTWVLGKISDALQPTIQSTVSGAGTFAGGALNTVGSGINGVGETINGTIKRYGDGVRDYGNGVMDWTNAPGVRAQTAGNPLGLNSGATGGKRSVTSPSLYAAPPKPKVKPKPTVTTGPVTTGKTTQTQKKVTAPVVKKSLPAPTSKVSTTSTKKTVVAASAKPVASKSPGVVGTRPAITSAVRPLPKMSPVTKSVSGMKPSTVPVKPSNVGKPGQVGALNPLGLSL